ncbi:MAG: hypothetical protein ACO1OK_01015 [Devosia sp.]
MSWNRGIRQAHRWVSLVFTATVAANFIAVALGQAIDWLYYLPLPPLFFLLGSGLYLFVLPYVARRSTASGRV